MSHLCRALETFNALDIQFVSLCEQVDTSTPTGKLVFTILGAVAEGERNLIAERVRAGLRNARAKGKASGDREWMLMQDQIALRERRAFVAHNRTHVRSVGRNGSRCG